MDAELKAKWVVALRSGEYEQGREFLYRDGRYCCLGVLSSIATNGQPYAHASSDYEELSRQGLRHFGMSPETQRTLINMNDLEGKSFSEIADEIERLL